MHVFTFTFAFSRRFYPKRITVCLGYTLFVYFATFLYDMFWLSVKVSLALVNYLFLLAATLRKNEDSKKRKHSQKVKMYTMLLQHVLQQKNVI